MQVVKDVKQWDAIEDGYAYTDVAIRKEAKALAKEQGGSLYAWRIILRASGRHTLEVQFKMKDGQRHTAREAI